MTEKHFLAKVAVVLTEARRDIMMTSKEIEKVWKYTDIHCKFSGNID